MILFLYLDNMVKPTNRPYAQVTLTSLQLFGQLIRSARIQLSYSTSELAERAGISRSLLQRIEKGDPRCAIGSYFEAAIICGVPIFTSNSRELEQLVRFQTEKLALLPKSVHPTTQTIQDDF